ncbi:MAG: formate dehydrogenase accessory sulfurtransferase FdhD, partial [Deltaproteobacteria bacterium]|nr:formate dehydrogenase accessory sulfurtransferase FdhD [Deltaproteobacteria bacterium]
MAEEEKELDDIILKWPIRRFFNDGRFNDLDDEVIDEYRLKIYLDGEEFLETVVLPSLLEEFVLGFFVTRGLVGGPEDISSLEISEGVAKVRRIPALQGRLPELKLLESTGSRNINPGDVSRSASESPGAELRVPAAFIIEQLKKFAGMPIFERTGATHCAILFTKDEAPVISAEDLGRHNAVDKVIGG